jgi:cell division protein FtsQ
MFYSIAIVVIGALMGFASSRHEHKTISGLNVSIADYDTIRFVNEKMVSSIVRKVYDSLEYKSKNNIDIAKLEGELQKINSVANAEVYVDIENKLSVNVEQRKPIGRVISKGKNFYIDEDGLKMPLSYNYTANVILIGGNVNDKNLKEIYTLLKFIRSNKVLNEQIVGMSVNKKNEYNFRTRKGNQIIEFGKAKNIERKFEKLLIYYRKTVSDFGWKRYKKINLKFTNQVVCTKR